MQRASKVFLAISVVLGMMGCRDDSPIVSGQAFDGGLFLGQYTVVEPDRTPKNWPLSPEQVGILSAWLKDHQSGWGMILASPPPPAFSVVVKQANGHSSRIDFFSRENWNEVIVIHAEDPADNRMASFSAPDVKHLRQQMGEVR
jgi:hypothetical protein